MFSVIQSELPQNFPLSNCVSGGYQYLGEGGAPPSSGASRGGALGLRGRWGCANLDRPVAHTTSQESSSFCFYSLSK